MERPQNALGSTWGVPTAATPLVPTAEPLGQKSKLPKPSGLSRLQQLLVAGMEKRAQQGVQEVPSPTPSQTTSNLETCTGATQSREGRSWSVLDNMKTLARDGGALPQLDSRLKKAKLSLETHITPGTPNSSTYTAGETGKKECCERAVAAEEISP